MVLVTGPTDEPLTVDDVQAQLRIADQDVDDSTTLARLIRSARHAVEGFTNRALLTQTWKHVADGWPWADGFFDLPANLQNVTSVQYTDPSGAVQTLDPSIYVVSPPVRTPPLAPRNERGRVSLAYSKYWPPPLVQRDVVTVAMTLGYGDTADTVPEDILAAMFLLIGTWYEERQDQMIVRGSADKLPRDAERILTRYQAGPITRQATAW